MTPHLEPLSLVEFPSTYTVRVLPLCAKFSRLYDETTPPPATCLLFQPGRFGEPRPTSLAGLLLTSPFSFPGRRSFIHTCKTGSRFPSHDDEDCILSQTDRPSGTLATPTCTLSPQAEGKLRYNRETSVTNLPPRKQRTSPTGGLTWYNQPFPNSLETTAPFRT